MTAAETRDRLCRALACDLPPSSDYDLNAGKPPPGAGLRGAGVLVPVLWRDGAARLMLTKRASHLAQHPGQIAFPGGKIEPDDADATAAALREAWEETGLPPAAVEVLGCMPVHETVTGYEITPVLGWVADPFDARPEPGEVAEIFTVPLAHVADPALYAVQSRLWRGRERRYFTVPYGPYYIWGATARILRGLADRLTA
ncbi:hydrolase, NUDIX family protein [Oceaniovalibus guishaninsula JLT2003]|uniref:Hydrolase, NUDIX family protein n=1 Tax=Oceaniovalibus guishaninsula JLT2003 TaxID=1231392 RepID=K2HP75_9RHOB|nr:CoA pyrophosphatase [Oceaniovalibus guishaninsula]EKE44654.1 hydrolase, NUDIX family protein [Oceaniovalibus guishaninsula JLT2003]